MQGAGLRQSRHGGADPCIGPRQAIDNDRRDNRTGGDQQPLAGGLAQRNQPGGGDYLISVQATGLRRRRISVTQIWTWVASSWKAAAGPWG